MLEFSSLSAAHHSTQGKGYDLMIFKSTIAMQPIKLLFFSVLLLIFNTGIVSAKLQLSSIEVKAAYVFNFIQYVQWQNENSLTEFRVGFYGDEKSYWKALKSMNGRKIRKKTIKIQYLSSLSDTSGLQLLVVGESKSKDLSTISKQLSGKGILLISDNSQDKKNTMLNFIYPDHNRLSFELNRYNIAYEKLKISPEILVLGGSELDVANVLKELETSLTESRSQFISQTEKLTILKNKTQQREKLLNQQKTFLKQQKDKIAIQNKTLSRNKHEFEKMKSEKEILSLDLKKTQYKFISNNTKLDEMQNLISKKQQSINELSDLITDRKIILEKQTKLLESQKMEISKKEIEIDEHLLAINKQSSTIQSQSEILTLAVFGFASVFLLILAIFANNRTKQKANQKLHEKNQQLADVNNQLKSAQSQLVESEKMAALGGLVAGIAHEINTPLGVGVTAASHLSNQISTFKKTYDKGQLKRSALENLLENAKQSTDMLSRNLMRASDLIRNFKLVAVDQSGENRRKFELKEYFEEIDQSLHPKLKKGKHSVSIFADQEITVDTYPGVLAQIMTNLIMNSIMHGFEGISGGEITIHLTLEDGRVLMRYQDNGVGMTSDQKTHVFEPFYTTKRALGGSGLGMSISYNLIVNKLGGSIQCVNVQKGALFSITFLQVAD